MVFSVLYNPATGVLNGDTGVVVASQTPEGTPVRMAVIDALLERGTSNE